MSEELIEVEQSGTMRREEAAALLRRVADQLARHNELELTRGGMRITAKVPDEVEVEVEIEITEDGGELEIELSW
ncbi:MAG TPA: amphi-Trp domain-containing protein [Acidimicrobiales bacterium]|nr:amphi-Trp domain-containing protein [Acidimicrobiales bacterium]